MYNQIYPIYFIQYFPHVSVDLGNVLIHRQQKNSMQLIDFIYCYLTKRKQRTKVDSGVSSWEMLFSGVRQGSVLGPIYNSLKNTFHNI